MKIKILFKLVMLSIILQSFACKNKTQDNELKHTMKFEKQWQKIVSTKTASEEKIEVEKLIDSVHWENASIGGRYKDLNGKQHNLSDAYILSDINEIESLIIEINIPGGNNTLSAEEYKNWKPKDLNNLHLFLNE